MEVKVEKKLVTKKKGQKGHTQKKLIVVECWLT